MKIKVKQKKSNMNIYELFLTVLLSCFLYMIQMGPELEPEKRTFRFKRKLCDPSSEFIMTFNSSEMIDIIRGHFNDRDYCLDGKHFHTSVPLLVFRDRYFMDYEIMNRSTMCKQRIVRPTCATQQVTVYYHEWLEIRLPSGQVQRIEDIDSLCFYHSETNNQCATNPK